MEPIRTPFHTQQPISILGVSQSSISLINAVNSKNISEITKLLSERLDINERDEKGRTALHYAIDVFDITKLLIEHGADLNPVDCEGYNPLMYSLGIGQQKVYNYLFEKGAVLRDEIPAGYSLLVNTYLKGDKEAFEFLLEKGANLEHGSRDNGTTLFLLAVVRNDIHLVKRLLDHVNINRTTSEGFTALYLAVDKGHQEIAKILLSRNPELNYTTTNQLTVLMVAAATGQKEIVEQLLKLGADHTKCIVFNGIAVQNALSWSISNKLFDIAEILLNFGAELPPSRFDLLKVSPQEFVDKYDQKHSHIIPKFSSAAVNPEDRDNFGRTIFFLRAAEGDNFQVLYLANEGRNINAINYAGLTPLMVAANNGLDSTVRLILSFKPAIDVKSHFQISALGYALYENKLECAQVLIEAGADIEGWQGSNFEPPLHIALYKQMMEIVDLLLLKKANVNSRSRSGVTPLHVAAQNCPDKIPALVKAGACLDSRSYSGLMPIDCSKSSRASSELLFAKTGNDLCKQFSTFPHAIHLLNYLYRLYEIHHRDKDYFQKQLELGLEICKKTTRHSEPFFFEFFNSMRFLNPNIEGDKDYLACVAEMLEECRSFEELSMAVYCLQYSPNLKEALSLLKEITDDLRFKATKDKYGPKEYTPSFIKYIGLLRKGSECRELYSQLWQLSRQKAKEESIIEAILMALKEIGNKRTSSNTRDLLKVYEKYPRLRALLLETLWETKPDPHHTKGLERVVAFINDSSIPDQDRIRAINVLSNYFVADTSVSIKLIEIADGTTNCDLRRACAMALLNVGHEVGLEKADKIINSSDWDALSNSQYDPNNDEVDQFTRWYRIPPQHLHRDRLNEVILEKRAQAKGPLLRQRAEAVYEEYCLSPNKYPSIQRFIERLTKIPENSRFIKPLIFYPQDAIIMRGLTDKGSGIIDINYDEIITKGSRKADLSHLKEINKCHWARADQTFLTHRLSYITTYSFFKDKSLLLGVKGSFINREILEGRGRFEKENGVINCSLYKGVPTNALESVLRPYLHGLPVTRKDRMFSTGIKKELNQRILKYDEIPSNETKAFLKQQGYNLTSDRKVVRESAIHFIMRELIRGSKELDQPFEIRTSKFDEMSSEQMNCYLQNEVFPRYLIKYDWYLKNGNRVDPFVMDYAIPHIAQIPRWHHGVLHAARATVLANVSYYLYELYFGRVIYNKNSLRVAIAMHDVARKDEGVDLWDKQSGEACQQEFLKMGATPEYAQEMGLTIEKKGKRNTLAQKIVDGSDCLDILRLGKFRNGFEITSKGTSSSSFHANEWPLYADLCSIGLQKYADQLLKEIWSFIQLTEKDIYKFSLERSPHVIQDLLALLKQGDYPLLHEIYRGKL